MARLYVGPMPVQPFASVTFTVIGKVPVCVGVPVRTPADVSETPVGSVPLLMLKVAGVCVPTPLCVKVKLAATRAALKTDDVVAGFVTVMVWQAMTSVYVALIPVQPLASVTLTVIGKLPGTNGVPETTPALESKRPFGSVPLLMVKVAGVCVPTPLWVKVWLNAASTVPVVTPGGVTVMVWQLMTSVYVAPVPEQPFASVAVTVIGKLPGAVGVPSRTPVAVWKVMPAGIAPVFDQVMVPLPPLWVKV